MTTTASVTPALQLNATIRSITQTVNAVIRYLYNRINQDLYIPMYAADTGAADAYAIAVNQVVKQYVIGQIFELVPANTNLTAAPTFNVSGLGAGTITYPDGSALVPGDLAANGSYLLRVVSTTPTFHLLSTTGGRSKLLQTVSTETGALATGTTTVAGGDTIMANTEGDQYMSLSVTPKSSTSKLRIHVTWIGTNTFTPGQLICGLFQDATVSALAQSNLHPPATSFIVCHKFIHIMTSGTVSATTFKVRVGANSAGTTTFNGSAGARVGGGAEASSIVIEEVLP